MRRLVITLTEHEYADLEQRAEAERRSVKDMAGWLVARPQTAQPAPQITPYVNPFVGGQTWNPLGPPYVFTDRTATPPNGVTAPSTTVGG